eukprot:PhF_6_TR13707/c0_g1_i1/m.22140/K10396/KIF5; kinesin family member 5
MTSPSHADPLEGISDFVTKKTNIRVFVRVRPPQPQETNVISVSTAVTDKNERISVVRMDARASVGGQSEYYFDGVFPPNCKQEEVFSQVAVPLLEDCLKGYSCTLFCYGQTGSGKTYTIGGENGIIPRSMRYIFERIEQERADFEYTILLQYVQIYMEKLKDLFAPETDSGALNIRQDDAGVLLHGAKSCEVTSLQQMMSLYKVGESNRIVGATNMNAVSSRSHSCLIVSITKSSRKPSAFQDELDSEEGDDTVCLGGKMMFVDLAGSERVAKTGAEGMRLEEAKSINLSLTTLGNVIDALTNDAVRHIPYRDSKLTRLLQDSLGKGKTSIIITLGPDPSHLLESHSSCMFGQRAMKVKTLASVHHQQDYKVIAMKLQAALDQAHTTIQELQELVHKLQDQLAKAQNSPSQPSSNSDKHIVTENYELRAKNSALEKKIEELQLQSVHYLQMIGSPTPLSPNKTRPSNTPSVQLPLPCEDCKSLKLEVDRLESALHAVTQSSSCEQCASSLSNLSQLQLAYEALQGEKDSLIQEVKEKKGYIHNVEVLLELTEKKLVDNVTVVEKGDVACEVDLQHPRINELESQIQRLLELDQEKNDEIERAKQSSLEHQQRIRELESELDAFNEAQPPPSEAEDITSPTRTPSYPPPEQQRSESPKSPMSPRRSTATESKIIQQLQNEIDSLNAKLRSGREEFLQQRTFDFTERKKIETSYREKLNKATEMQNIIKKECEQKIRELKGQFEAMLQRSFGNATKSRNISTAVIVTNEVVTAEYEKRIFALEEALARSREQPLAILPPPSPLAQPPPPKTPVKVSASPIAIMHAPNTGAGLPSSSPLSPGVEFLSPRAAPLMLKLAKQVQAQEKLARKQNTQEVIHQGEVAEKVRTIVAQLEVDGYKDLLKILENYERTIFNLQNEILSVQEVCRMKEEDTVRELKRKWSSERAELLNQIAILDTRAR